MSIRFDKMLLSTTKLKNELLIAFGLIVLTLLVLVGFLFPGVASVFTIKTSFPFILGIIFLILVLGFIIIIQIVEPVIQISREAKMIAKGDIDRKIELVRKDELGELGSALNEITDTIRLNVTELKQLSQTTESLNMEINGRIEMLSNLLELSNSIADNASLHDLMSTIINKCFAPYEMNFGGILLKEKTADAYRIRALYGPVSEDLETKKEIPVNITPGEGVLGKALLSKEVFTVDQTTCSDKESDDFKRLFSLTNTFIAPITTEGSAHGLLIVGNEKKQFEGADTIKEMLQLIAKHIAIATLNHKVFKKVESLEETDHLTGLLNSKAVRKYLNEEVQKAINFQKTCSFILLHMNHCEQFQNRFGQIELEKALIKVSNILKEENCLNQHKISRFSEHDFAIISPSKNKKDSIQLAEQIIEKIDHVFVREEEGKSRLSGVAAVVENPIDGMNADDLINKSQDILKNIIEKGQRHVGYKL